jgi:hypothetical protein
VVLRVTRRNIPFGGRPAVQLAARRIPGFVGFRNGSLSLFEDVADAAVAKWSMHLADASLQKDRSSSVRQFPPSMELVVSA